MNTFINKLSMAVVVVCGCGGTPIQASDSVSLDAVQDNGRELNGISYNGISYNGISYNGISYNGIAINGSLLTQTAAIGGVSVKDYVGVTFPSSLTDGTTVTMRLDGVATDATSGFNVYNVSVKTDDAWVPICGTLNGAPVPVVPVPGSWDSTTGTHTEDSKAFTFACVNAAIGKCVLWGYNPWATKKECYGNDCRTQSLVPWLEACTRMVRADYCGVGSPHTRNGTPINIWDPLNIQVHASTSWSVEADWERDGGHCIKHTRWVQADSTSAGTDMDYIVKNCPSRLAVNAKDECGVYSDFSTRNGLKDSPSSRKLLRNESALNQ